MDFSLRGAANAPKHLSVCRVALLWGGDNQDVFTIESPFGSPATSNLDQEARGFAFTRLATGLLLSWMSLLLNICA